MRHARRDPRKAVMQRRRGDDEIGLGKGVARLAALLNKETPLEDDVFADRQHALIKHLANLMGEPIIQFGPFRGIGDGFDATANLGQRDGADE